MSLQVKFTDVVSFAAPSSASSTEPIYRSYVVDQSAIGMCMYRNKFGFAIEAS